LVSREGLSILEELCQSQKLPNILLSTLNKIANDKNDPLNRHAESVLNTTLVYNHQIHESASVKMVHRSFIVSREQISVKRTHNFRSNILDLNLKQKVNS
jgi:hypothetical protein